jgi:hypothetical protein
MDIVKGTGWNLCCSIEMGLGHGVDGSEMVNEFSGEKMERRTQSVRLWYHLMDGIPKATGGCECCGARICSKPGLEQFTVKCWRW